MSTTIGTLLAAANTSTVEPGVSSVSMDVTTSNVRAALLNDPPDIDLGTKSRSHFWGELSL